MIAGGACSNDVVIIEPQSSTTMHLKNKVALITGASRGIGRAMAQRFADEGADLVICARHREALLEVARDIESRGGRVIARAADVGDRQDVHRLVAMALETFHRIDVLVNNASILGPRVELVAYPYEEWERVLRINLTGTFLITQAVAQHMMERKCGSIINVSSGVGVEGRPRWGAYSVSKFGVEALTQIWSQELRPYHIRVNVVNPGRVRTEMRRAAYPDEDPNTLPRPEEILDVFVYLASDESRAMTGQRFQAQEFKWPKRE